MLAKAPLNVSESIKFGGNNFRRSPPIVEHGHGCHFRGISELQWRRSRVLSVRASSETGYTRKPLETAGAYELIDEETGEKVIVWGGAEDDPVIPSKGVLSWNPQSRRDAKNYKSSSGSSSNGVESASSVESDDLSARRKDLPGSFAKLKAQKIRALSRKGSHVKKDGAGNEDIRQGDQSFRGLDTLDSELQFMLKNKNRDYPRNKRSISIASKSHHVQERTGSFESTPSSNISNTDDNLGFEKTFAKPHEIDFDKEDASVPRVAVTAPLREWNRGVHTQNSRYDSKDASQKSLDSGFFSKKSFKDLGCSEDIIESLKGQLFYCPSRIQSMAFASAFEGKSCIIADQSGSGKTLAYLAPIIQRLRQEELNGLGKSASSSPRVVILVPTAELGPQVLVDCSGDDRMEKTPETAFQNKKSALLQLLDESPVAKTIIFCNKIETCRKVENVLKRLDTKEACIRVLPFHSALAQEARLDNMKMFLKSQSKEDSLFLICTDRASRGIDFSGVNHVVLFDFPRDPSEYVGRVGRTARGAGGKGKAFVFVVGKQVSLARRIIERNRKGHPLHDVPSAYGVLSY